MASKHSLACIYCGAPAATRDHVPPRAFLERPYPANLRTVPSCRDCNHGFSLDEEYFLILLAKISTSPFLQARLADGGAIDRALSQKPALDDRLLASLEVDDEGRVLIRPEHDRVQRIIRKIAIGLYVLRFGRVPAIDSVTRVEAYPYCTRDDRPVPIFVATFTEKFRAKRWVHSQPKVFSHLFVRDPRSSSRVWCIMNFHESLWGVVYLPNPQSVKVRNDGQLWLFVEKQNGLTRRQSQRRDLSRLVQPKEFSNETTESES